MNFWNFLWILLVSVAVVVGIRDALEIYLNPREIRTNVSYLDAQQARRTAVLVLFFLPIVWLIIALLTFGFV